MGLEVDHYPEKVENLCSAVSALLRRELRPSAVYPPLCLPLPSLGLPRQLDVVGEVEVAVRPDVGALFVVFVSFGAEKRGEEGGGGGGVGQHGQEMEEEEEHVVYHVPMFV